MRHLRLLIGVAGALLALGASTRAAESPGRGRTAAPGVFAAVDFTPAPGEAARNRERLAKLVAEAARRGARYVVTPELAVVGPLDARDGRGRALDPGAVAEPVPGPTTDFFGRHAQKLGVWLAVSVVERSEAGGYYLTSVLIDDRGRVASRCRKTMVRLNAEDAQATRATNYLDVPDTVDDGGRRLGVISGDDLQVGVPRLAARGADTILVTAGWGGRDAAGWEEMARRLSKEFLVNIVVATRGGGAERAGGVYAPLAEPVRSGAAGAPAWMALAALSRHRNSWHIEAALGLPSVPVPSHQPPNAEIAELGRTLFFDTNLSSNKTVSCSTCHLPDRAFTNGQPRGVGVEGRTTKRNPPTLLNVAYRSLVQWDGYASSIENFVKYPLSNFTEMNFHYLDNALVYVKNDPAYARTFRSSMGVEKLEFEHIERALATYLRTLISGNSAFDRYFYGGERAALGEGARRGLKLFTGKADCARCHVIGDRYALFMDFKFHSLGVGYDQRNRVFVDVGLGGISTDAYSGLFQTPSLRNVAETAPYMHDGSFATLEEVVEFYDAGAAPNPLQGSPVKPLRLTAQEKGDLIAFLRSLTGDHQYTADGRRVGARPNGVAKAKGDAEAAGRP